MQDESINQKLDDIHELTEENNRLIKAMRRDARIGMVVKAIFWVALIGVSTYFTMQLINPLISSFMPGTGDASNTPSAEDLQKLLDQYKGQ